MSNMLLNELLEITANKLPYKEAMVCGNQRFNYRRINEHSNSFANSLIYKGFRRQDKALIYLDNCAENIISIYGILKASGIFVPVSSLIKPNRLQYMLNDTKANTLVTDSKSLQKIRTILNHTPNLKWIILIDEKPNSGVDYLHETHIEVLTYKNIIEKYSAVSPVNHNIDIDLASIIYTSGSTNFSKGSLLTHLNMVSAANSIINYINNTSEDIILTCLPLSFDYSLYQVLTAFQVGAKVIIEKNFLYPTDTLDRILIEEVTGFSIVPTMAAILKEFNFTQRYDLSSVRYICSSAQSLPAPLIDYLQKLLFPDANIYSMYGLTECKSVSGLQPEDIKQRPTSVGKALPNMEVYVINENGEKKYRSGEGELVVRGANVMKGYLNNPEETAKKLKPGEIPGENVLYTGDLFRIDEDGYLYFLGRIDDMINCSGIQVSPKEIEDVLYQVDGVLEAVVFRIPDEIRGEAIKAVISKQNDSTLNESMLREHCHHHLEKMFIPQIFEIKESLPKTPNGKIDKKSLMSS